MPDSESEDDLNKDIAKKKYTWKAGKTAFSEMSPEERQKRLGLTPTEQEKERMRKKTEK